MTAVEALRAARSAKVHVGLDGNDLVLRAPAPPPPALIDALKRHKPGIVALLRRARGDWTAADWEAFFHERAGIAEYDGGLGRPEAEALAFEHCVVEWLMRHSVRSNPGACLSCGRVEDEGGIVLPFGIEASGHAWLHSIAGHHGIPKGGQKQLLPWRPWGFRRQAVTIYEIFCSRSGRCWMRRGRNLRRDTDGRSVPSDVEADDHQMPRSRQRTCLQDGLKLDISWLARRGLIAPGLVTGPNSIRWVNSHGEVIASGWISADMEGDTEGSLCIRIGELDQRVPLVTLPRHYGGRQWFFVSPVTNGRASVLWLPPGAQHFACRHAWPRQVAYRSPFMTPMDRGPSRQGKDQAATERRA
jgi:hypothetical protein